MKITVVNFANETFKTQQKYSTWSLKNIGGVAEVISYAPDDIKEYIDSFPEFKKYSKGFGNYFWKPYIIQQALSTIGEDDFLIYMDSGTFILKRLTPLCEYLNNIGKDILVFQSPLIAKQWTKKDTFVLLNANTRCYYDACQLLAGYIVIKNTQKAREFIENYRLQCTDERIVSDLPNVMGFPNESVFKEHRHDQSVLTVLSRNSSIVQIERDPSDYGVFPEQYFKNTDRLYDAKALDKSNYKFRGFLVSNRKAHPLWYILKYVVKRIVRLVCYYLNCKKY